MAANLNDKSSTHDHFLVHTFVRNHNCTLHYAPKLLYQYTSIIGIITIPQKNVKWEQSLNCKCLFIEFIVKGSDI